MTQTRFILPPSLNCLSTTSFDVFFCLPCLVDYFDSHRPPPRTSLPELVIDQTRNSKRNSSATAMGYQMKPTTPYSKPSEGHSPDARDHGFPYSSIPNVFSVDKNVFFIEFPEILKTNPTPCSKYSVNKCDCSFQTQFESAPPQCQKPLKQILTKV